MDDAATGCGYPAFGDQPSRVGSEFSAVLASRASLDGEPAVATHSATIDQHCDGEEQRLLTADGAARLRFLTVALKQDQERVGFVSG